MRKAPSLTRICVPDQCGTYAVGFDLDDRARTAITQVPQGAWQAVSDAEGNPRDLDDAGVVQTGLTTLTADGFLRPA